MASHVLYITHDGITDHIGRSQIAPYLMGLARAGHRITVLSAEKPGREVLIARYFEQFRAVGIEWEFVRYRNRPPIISTGIVLLQMWWRAIRIVRRSGVTAVHCRSYLPSLLGLRLKERFGTRFLFDPRDFYPDGLRADRRLDVERKAVHRLIYRFLKRKETAFVARADHIVSLTEAGKRVLEGWQAADAAAAPAPISVIPCCADFAVFDRSQLDPVRLATLRQRLNIAPNDFVLFYHGSLHSIYMVDEMFEFFRVLQSRRPNARFLIAANNHEERIKEAMRHAGVDPSAVVLTWAEQDEVPYFIAQGDLGVMFIRTEAKQACSPVKLAELLAMDVPVVGNTGLGDVDEILRLDINGSTVVHRFDAAAYGAALDEVLEHAANGKLRIRESAGAFALDTGVASYGRIYRSLSG